MLQHVGKQLTLLFGGVKLHRFTSPWSACTQNFEIKFSGTYLHPDLETIKMVAIMCKDGLGKWPMTNFECKFFNRWNVLGLHFHGFWHFLKLCTAVNQRYTLTDKQHFRVEYKSDWWICGQIWRDVFTHWLIRLPNGIQPMHNYPYCPKTAITICFNFWIWNSLHFAAATTIWTLSELYHDKRPRRASPLPI